MIWDLIHFFGGSRRIAIAVPAVLSALCSLGIAPMSGHAAKVVPEYPPSTLVYEEKPTLNPENFKRIENYLLRHERATGDQIVIALFQGLEGETPSGYANRVYASWGLGEKGKDNGLLVAFFLIDKQVAIEVGYGLEHVVTDAFSKRVIDTAIVPQMKKGDLNAAILSAIEMIFVEIESPVIDPTKSKAARDELQQLTEFGNKVPSLVVLFFALIPLLSIFLIIYRLRYAYELDYQSKGWRPNRKGRLGFDLLDIFLILGALSGRRGRSHHGGFGGGGFGGGSGGGFGGFGGGRSGGGGASGGW